MRDNQIDAIDTLKRVEEIVAMYKRDNKYTMSVLASRFCRWVLEQERCWEKMRLAPFANIQSDNLCTKSPWKCVESGTDSFAEGMIANDNCNSADESGQENWVKFFDEAGNKEGFVINSEPRPETRYLSRAIVLLARGHWEW